MKKVTLYRKRKEPLCLNSQIQRLFQEVVYLYVNLIMAPSPDNRTIDGIYDTNVVIKFETVLAIQGPNIGIIKYINKN